MFGCEGALKLSQACSLQLQGPGSLRMHRPHLPRPARFAPACEVTRLTNSSRLGQARPFHVCDSILPFLAISRPFSTFPLINTTPHPRPFLLIAYVDHPLLLYTVARLVTSQAWTAGASGLTTQPTNLEATKHSTARQYT